MGGDNTRFTFNQKNHYNSVLMQQGRVQLDADWNEQMDIQAYIDRTTTGDTVGLCGAPIWRAAAAAHRGPRFSPAGGRDVRRG